MAPDSWRTRTLGEIATIIMGNSPVGSSYNDKGVGIPLLNGPTEFGARHPSPTQWTTSPTKQCEVGDVLFCVRGATTGKQNLADATYCIGRGLAAIRERGDASTTEFLRHLLGSVSKAILREAEGSGSTFANINFDRLSSWPVLIPPLPEQRKIAAILSSVDETIEKTEAVIERLDVVKKAMLEELLTRGMPGRHSRFKETEIGVVPEGWSVAQLAEVVDPVRPITYGIVQPGEYDPEGVLLIRGQDYIGRWRPTDGCFRVTAKLHATYRRSQVRPGDVLLCIVGATTGSCNIVPESIVEANITQTTARVAADSTKALPAYVRAYLESAVGQSQVRKFIKGSAQPGLNLRDVEKFLVPVPALDEQAWIARAATGVDALRDLEVSSLDRMQVVKRALSATLLSGEVQVLP